MIRVTPRPLLRMWRLLARATSRLVTQEPHTFSLFVTASRGRLTWPPDQRIYLTPDGSRRKTQRFVVSKLLSNCSGYTPGDVLVLNRARADVSEKAISTPLSGGRNLATRPDRPWVDTAAGAAISKQARPPASE